MKNQKTAEKPSIAPAVSEELARIKAAGVTLPENVDRARWLAAHFCRFNAPQVIMRGVDKSQKRVTLSWIVGPWNGRAYAGVEVEVHGESSLTCREWDTPHVVGREWTSSDTGSVHRVKVALATLYQKFD